MSRRREHKVSMDEETYAQWLAFRRDRRGENPSLKVRLLGGLGILLRENVRAMVLFSGVVAVAQAFVPWTNDRMDVVWFVIFGSIMLGLGIPKRLWQ